MLTCINQLHCLVKQNHLPRTDCNTLIIGMYVAHESFFSSFCSALYSFFCSHVIFPVFCALL